MSDTDKFQATSYQSKGNVYWRVRIGYNEKGNAKYEPFKTDKEAAELYAKKLNIRDKAKRKGALETVSNEEAVDLRWAIEKLGEYGATVKDAAQWFINTKFPSKGNKTVRECGEIYIKHRRNEVKWNTLASYEKKIEKLSDYFEEKLINEINTADLNKYFDTVGKVWNANTENPNKNFVKFYFRWLQKHGYIHREGLTAMDFVSIPQKVNETPKLATPEEAAAMLYWFCGEADKKGKLRAESIRGSVIHLILILFCGIRRFEACQITWKDIDTKKEILKVLIEGAKKRRRRVNKAEKNVWSWIRYLEAKGASLEGYTIDEKGIQSDPQRRLGYRTNQYRKSFVKEGKKIPEIVATIEGLNYKGEKDVKIKNQNMMRHSFISYHMEIYKKAGFTAKIAGNREREVEETYMELVEDQRDAIVWFGIYPPEEVEKEDSLCWTLEEAFQKHLKKKLLEKNTDKSEEIAKAFVELQSDINSWEMQLDPETGEQNMHALAKKIEWFDDPKVKWDDGSPIIKEINLE